MLTLALTTSTNFTIVLAPALRLLTAGAGCFDTDHYFYVSTYINDNKAVF
jgi:hypothetical protein